MQPDDKPEQWRKSSFSNGQGGDCIEVDDAHPGTVRDSKDPDGPRLRFSAAAFAAFVTDVKAGTFGDV
ncbi:DUF397 domain-containing protein [Kitasatospora purpeofusca]|uniref:DUF397 domain-containing protein n=1 Tax=Kitasatospora purpeofusca TaxID=67352 RepID=UPI00382041F9